MSDDATTNNTHTSFQTKDIWDFWGEICFCKLSRRPSTLQAVLEADILSDPRCELTEDFPALLTCMSSSPQPSSSTTKPRIRASNHKLHAGGFELAWSRVISLLVLFLHNRFEEQKTMGSIVPHLVWGSNEKRRGIKHNLNLRDNLESTSFLNCPDTYVHNRLVIWKKKN